MKFLEAMEVLGNGGKVRRYGWVKGEYLTLDENGGVVDGFNRPYYISKLTDDWEEYKEDTREEVLQVYKDLYRIVNEAMRVPIEDDLLLKWISQNDFRYMIDELQAMLNLINLYYRLDK